MTTDAFPVAAPRAALNRVVAAFSCWFTAACFLVAWWAPRALEDGRWIKLGVAFMVIEFLMVHAGLMLTALAQSKPLRTTTAVFGALVAAYLLMGLAASVAMGSLWVLLPLALLLLGRARALRHPEDPLERAISVRRSSVSAILFLLLTFATVLVPMPAGGIDHQLLAEVWPHRGSGLWEQQPQQALAMGLLYFTILGAVELRAPSARWTNAQFTRR